MQLGAIQRWEGRRTLPKIICLHGFLGNGKDFTIVKDHYPNHPILVAPNFPDYTERPTEDFSWNHCMSSLDRFIQSESTHGPCVLMGYSMGGRIALQYALQHSDQLDGLILIGATPGIADEDEKVIRLEKDRTLAAELKEQSMAHFLGNWFKQDIIQSQNQIPEPYRSAMLTTRKANNRVALIQSLSSLGTGSMTSGWDQLSRFKRPTLLVTGEQDSKFQRIASKMATLLPNAHHTSIKGAGHACCFEQAESFGKAVETFLSSINVG